MRVLGIGDSMDLGSMYLDLLREGHEVRVFVADATASEVLNGLVVTTPDWRGELDWVRAAGADPAWPARSRWSPEGHAGWAS